MNNYSYKPKPIFVTPKEQRVINFEFWQFYKIARGFGFGRLRSWYTAWETNEAVEQIRTDVCEYISKGYELEIEPNTNIGETK